MRYEFSFPLTNIAPSQDLDIVEESWEGMGHPLATLVEGDDYQSALARYKARPVVVYMYCKFCKCEIDRDEDRSLGSIGILGREIRPDLCVGCASDWVEKHR